jgi:hypothetical protein
MINRLLPIIMVVAAAAIIAGYIYPTYTGPIAQTQQQIVSYDSALAAANVFSQKEADLTTKSNAIDPAALVRLQTYMPDGVDNIQLIADLDALAARSGLALSGFSIQEDPAFAQASSNGSSTPIAPVIGSSGGTNSLQLSVSAIGTYDAFQSFLNAAEQSARPLDITKLTLKYSTTGVYTYGMTFNIYWLK